MHYVIQENVFREQHYNILEESLKRLGLTYTVVRCYPYIDKVVALEDIPDVIEGDIDDLPDYNPNDKNVFCFGAIKLARIAAEQEWNPGSMMSETHNYTCYSEYWKDNLLNYDSKICRLVDNLEWKEGEVKFIRPTKDTKSFTGALFTKSQWEESLENNLHNYKSDVFNENTLIQVASPKNIQQEIRCWVVGGRVVSASTYRRGNDVIYQEYNEPDGLEFATSMINIFQLADAFVIDICLNDGEWKIVEAGCINAAGFYKCDMQKIIMALEDYYG